MPSTFKFCLPTSARAVPDRPNWLHEVKYDGYRMMLIRDGERVRRVSRVGIDCAARFPWIVEAARKRQHKQLPKDIIASFLRVSRLIESEGLERMREPYVRHLEGSLWEMRIKGKDGIARAAYVTATGRRVVVRVFPKKTQKTPVAKSSWP